MKNQTNFIVLGGILTWAALTLFQPTNASADQKPTMCVAKTQSSIPTWQPALGEGLAQMMITELSSLGTFTILESVALDDLREERSLGESGEVGEHEKVKKGGWEGADYTFKSTVTRFGEKKSSFGGGGVRLPVPFVRRGGIQITENEHEVQIDWRIVDNQTREVVAQGRGQGCEKGRGFSFSTGYQHGGMNTQEFMETGLGKATMKAIARITEQLREVHLATFAGRQEIHGAEVIRSQPRDDSATQARKTGEVLLVTQDRIVVSVGANHGFAQGDPVKLYKRVEKTNKAGKTVVMMEPIGDLLLTNVGKDQSTAQARNGVICEEGWIVAHPAAAL